MPISPADLQAAFLGSLPLNLKTLREQYGCVSIDLLPAASSPLRLHDERGAPRLLSIRTDAVMGLATLMNGAWEPVKQDHLARLLTGFDRPLTLVDIGANVGLFSRQCLNRFEQITRVHCYEPDPLNFRLLSRNLGGLGRVTLNNFGLSDEEGEFDLHRDPDNAGNSSLNAQAMPPRYHSTRVAIRKAASEMPRWLAPDDNAILYKSDTQGFDETIACALDTDFWQRVKVGIFELWRLPGKRYDRDRFAKLLDAFPNRMLEQAPQAMLSTRQVLQYLESTDRAFDDLYVWR
jgi:FkbM family methyltransferase